MNLRLDPSNQYPCFDDVNRSVSESIFYFSQNTSFKGLYLVNKQTSGTHTIEPNKVHINVSVCYHTMMKQSLLIVFLSIICWTKCGAYKLDKHHDFEEMLEVMRNVNNRCPDNTRLYKLPPLGIEEHDASVYPFNVSDETVEGRELWVIEFARTPGRHVPGNLAIVELEANIQICFFFRDSSCFISHYSMWI